MLDAGLRHRYGKLYMFASKVFEFDLRDSFSKVKTVTKANSRRLLQAQVTFKTSFFSETF